MNVAMATSRQSRASYLQSPPKTFSQAARDSSRSTFPTGTIFPFFIWAYENSDTESTYLGLFRSGLLTILALPLIVSQVRPFEPSMSAITVGSTLSACLKAAISAGQGGIHITEEGA